MTYKEFIIDADELLTIVDDPEMRIYDASIMFYINLSREEAAKLPLMKIWLLRSGKSASGSIQKSSCTPTGYWQVLPEPGGCCVMPGSRMCACSTVG